MWMPGLRVGGGVFWVDLGGFGWGLWLVGGFLGEFRLCEGLFPA